MICYLHIGTEKTGTTSIQEFLFRNKKKLTELNVLYPSAWGDRNHLKFSSFFDTPPWKVYRKFSGDNEVLSRNKTVSEWNENFEKEISHFNPSKVIISNEHLHTHINKKRQLEDMREYLSRFFEEVVIVLYVRRQDKMALSRFSTSIKAGAFNRAAFQSPNNWVYDYLQSFKLWSNVFGLNNVKLRVFEKRKMYKESLIDDFMSVLNVGNDGFTFPEKKYNESLSAKALSVLEFLNSDGFFIRNNISGKSKKMVIDQISHMYSGEIYKPSKSKAENFYYNFKRDNDKLFNSSGIELNGFEEDFSSYPDSDVDVLNENREWVSKNKEKIFQSLINAGVVDGY